MKMDQTAFIIHVRGQNLSTFNEIDKRSHGPTDQKTQVGSKLGIHVWQLMVLSRRLQRIIRSGLRFESRQGRRRLPIDMDVQTDKWKPE